MAIAPDRVLRALLPAAAWLARPLIQLLALSWRTGWAAGSEHLDRLAGEGRPAIYALWHHGVYAVGYTLFQRQARRRVRFALLVSQSRDGELVARLAGKLDVELVRGSTSRGARAALRQLYRAVTQRQRSVLTAPDGPRGPARVAQLGSVTLAQASGAPIVPVAAAASRAWRLRTWDRLLVPKPCARVALAAGEPRRVPRDADVAAATEALGQRLDELAELCEGALRRRPGSGDASTPGIG